MLKILRFLKGIKKIKRLYFHCMYLTNNLYLKYINTSYISIMGTTIRHFTRENIQMDYKHVKICLTQLVIKEIKIKTSMK